MKFRLTTKWLQLALWSAIIVGIVFHATVRDRIDKLSVLFYLLPLPVLLGMALALSVSRRQRIAALLVAAAITAAWSWRAFTWHEPEPKAPDEVSVLYWNLGRPAKPFKPLIGMIQKLKPDFVACVEPGPNADKDIAAYKAALPGYDCQYMPRGLLWFSRYPSRYRARGRLDSIGAYAVFEAEVKDRTLRFVAADVYADPLRPRGAQIKEVLGFANHDPRVVVMGDFNTPSESVHFDAYRQELLQDAIETGGKGFRETWFWGLPLLSLDHMWLGKDWHVLEAHKIWTFSSDHAAIFVRMR